MRWPMRIVAAEHYRTTLQKFGRGWVQEESNRVVAFGIADQAHRNIWALFVRRNLKVGA